MRVVLWVPTVRSRERNLTLTGFVFMSDNYSDVLGAIAAVETIAIASAAAMRPNPANIPRTPKPRDEYLHAKI